MSQIGKRIILYFIIFFTFVSVTGTVSAGEAGKLFELNILHINDSHGHVEQYPYLKTVIDEFRKEGKNPIVLHAGDVFTGTLYFSKFRGLADADFFNRLLLDAFTLGNHEFDYLPSMLADFINSLHFPVVSANIDFTDVPPLNKLFEKSFYKKEKGGKIYPFIIKTYNDEKVAIFGLTTDRTPEMADAAKDIPFKNPMETAEKMVELLTKNGFNKIILLSHLGLEADRVLAEKVEGIDIIVGGHSHQAQEKPIVIRKDSPTLIAHADEYLKSAGKLNVIFNEKGEIVKFNGSLVPLGENIKKEPSFEKRVALYKSRLEKYANKKVGFLNMDLEGSSSLNRTKETPLGNIITDTLLWRMKKVNPDVAVSFINGGSIRGSLKKGWITKGDVRTVFPFENQMVMLELTGEEIVQILEKSINKYPAPNSGFLQVSGIRFRFNPSNSPGHRIVSVEVKNKWGGFSKIEKEKLYPVVTNGFLANGGDHYDVLKKAAEEGRIKKYQIKDYEAFIDYLKENSPVNPKMEGRIVPVD